mmetsp:Transcript_13450/g.29207  ORF Transcript_13450/g.29207 Transcript_13450/m.29207 type:complete len:481 (+) Transcript_13450:130-1572(+)|eukprot:CAMPEP_0172323978 /NCGR_PEP_ID=MMETSP1058-20130122/50064_1 /TAXON_ID=83371 /ORGANISM="Detonula confervacea, Strain CCMP 353" /LENGTH=480 /DNA_ID=CAMNT_0013040123 /DNA_START=101 /DNA_END=1543 /DNA_ORIENTATION=-
MGSGKRNRHSNNQSGSRGSGSSSNKNKNYEEPITSPARQDSDDEDMDFCQRFFGDPLFSNLNVSLLFLTATFLPMIVWIPHFLSEYRRLRHIQFLEEERQMRMQKARMEVKSTQQQQQQSAVGGGEAFVSQSDNDITILQDSITPLNSKSTIHFPDPHVLNPHIHPSSNGGQGSNNNASGKNVAQATILPTLCPDGVTIGYDNWFLLRDAISEANAIAAEEFLRWNEYLVQSAKNSSTEPPVYHPPEPFVICPGVTLNQKSPYRSFLSPYYWASYLVSFLPYTATTATGSSSQAMKSRSTPKSKNKLSPIFINAEDITIECDMCTVDLPGTHFSFGPHAKNVLIKGITFRGATTSSLTFHYHGADVNLQDCYWLYNSGGVVNNNRNGPYANVNSNEGLMSTPPGSTTTAGAVADLNSTSTVTFFRCVIDDVKQNPKRTTTGAGVANVPGMNPPAGHHAGGGMNQGNGGGGVVSSSLTIRN